MNMANSSALNPAVLIESLQQLSREYYDLHPNYVTVSVEQPTADYFRHFVNQNIPVLIKNAVQHWPAIKKWDYDYLRSKLKEDHISVALTPNGLADAVVNGKFVIAQETFFTINAFLDTLINPRPFVTYIQKQNSNLIEDFSSLLPDVQSDIPWASEVIGDLPDAVNFWMGDERAITSMHKDHYENIFCVIRGRKKFILHPPIDAPWIPYKSYDAAVYARPEVDDSTADLGKKVNWIPIDPLNPNFEEYPLYRNARPLHVTVEEGDALYIPSLWFHHVRQSHGCIAVNYWYDMEFDAKFCYFNFLTKMGSLLHDAT